MARQPQIPGGDASDSAELVSGEAEQQGDSPEVATLKAKLAEAEAKLAQAGAAAQLPQVAYEPVTPNGAIAIEASAYRGMTSSELARRIKAGEIQEPMLQVLCSDGYYVRRSYLG